MTCALDNFNQEFDNILTPGGEVNISQNPRVAEIMQYVDVANKTAKTQGFDLNLFNLKEKNNETFLKVEEDTLTQYDDYSKFLRESLDQMGREENMFDTILNESFPIKEFGHTTSLMTDEEIKRNTDALMSVVNPNVEEKVNYSLIVGSAKKDYSVWLETRKQLLKQLRTTIKSLKKNSPDKKDLIKSLRIEEEILQHEIKNIDVTDIDTVEQGIRGEIENLQKLLEEVLNPVNPVETLAKIESGLIQERIDMLEHILNTTTDNGISFMFANIREGITPESLNKILADFSDLKIQYQNAIPNIIATIVSNDSYILTLKEMAVSKEEVDDIESFVEKMKEVILQKNAAEMGGDGILGATFLGAGSYNNILARMLYITHERNINREAGSNALHKKQLLDSYKTLIKKLGKKTVSDFWQKDLFGTPTNRIINFFTPRFERMHQNFKKAEINFFNTIEGTDVEEAEFEDFMTTFKKNMTVFDIRSIPEIYEKYKGHPQFSQYFTSSKENMEDYKKRLVEYLGEATYSSLVAEQIEKLEDYSTDPFVSLLSGIDDNSNPFVYANHFYSDNYTKALDNGKFPNSKYMVKLPISSIYVDKRFKNLEERAKAEGVFEEFKTFYRTANTLIRYNKQTKKSFGVFEDANSIVELENSAKREAVANAKWYLKVPYFAKNSFSNIWSKIFEAYRRGDAENEEGSKDYDIEKDRHLKTHFGDSLTAQRNKRFKIYSNWTNKKLEEYAVSIGISKDDIFEAYFEDDYRQVLINGIINKEFENSITLDLPERLLAETMLSESANARRATEGLWELMKKYGEGNRNFKNFNSFLEDYGAQNIYQLGKLDTGHGAKIMRTSITKAKSRKEKELISLLKNEKKNLGGNYNFTFENYKYYRDKKRNYRERNLSTGEEIELTVVEIHDKYKEYLDNEIAKIGTKITIGKILTGLKWKMATNFLGINPASGIKNLIGGQGQLRQKAASGLWDFGMDEYERAFNIFYGQSMKSLYKTVVGETASDKTLNIMAKLPGVKHLPTIKRSEQIRVVSHLANKLGLFSIKSEDNRGVDSWSIDKSQHKIADLVSGMSIDIPEFYNQMVGLVAMMQNERYAIEDVNGVKHPLFNGKTGEFVFDTKTMELKPQFRTQKNIDNWEHFRASEDGVAPHEVLFARFDQMRNASQGNYKSTSKTGIDKTYIGSASMAFLKWLPELLNNEVGTNTLDPIWMKQNTMGRLATLYAQKPYIFLAVGVLEAASVPLNIITAISFFAISNPLKAESWKNVSKDLFLSFAGLATLAAATRGAEIAAWTKVFIAHKNLKDANNAFRAVRINRKSFLSERPQANNKSTKMEKFSEIVGLATELGLRTGRTTTGLITGAVTRKRRTLLKDERIKNIIGLHKEKYASRDISYEDRLLISEKLQGYAESVSQAITGLIILHSYKFVYMVLAALVGGDDDDEKDEEYWERLEKILKDDEKRAEAFKRIEPYIGNYENKMKYFITVQGGIQKEMRQFSGPTSVLTLFDGFIMQQQYDKITTMFNRALDDEDINKTFYEKYSPPITTVTSVAVGVPNTILKPITGKELFSYERVYGDYDKVVKTNFYSDVLDYGKTKEEKYKGYFNEKRKEVRDIYKIKAGNELDRVAKEKGAELTEEKRDKLIEKYKNIFYKQNNLSTTESTKYVNKIEKIDWEVLTKKAENVKINSLAEPKNPKKPSGNTSFLPPGLVVSKKGKKKKGGKPFIPPIPR